MVDRASSGDPVHHQPQIRRKGTTYHDHPFTRRKKQCLDSPRHKPALATDDSYHGNVVD